MSGSTKQPHKQLNVEHVGTRCLDNTQNALKHRNYVYTDVVNRIKQQNTERLPMEQKVRANADTVWRKVRDGCSPRWLRTKSRRRSWRPRARPNRTTYSVVAHAAGGTVRRPFASHRHTSLLWYIFSPHLPPASGFTLCAKSTHQQTQA